MKPLKAMLKHEVDRLSLRNLEYEMENVDIPDDDNFSKLDIVVTLPPLTHVLN